MAKKHWFCPVCEGTGIVGVAYLGRVNSNDPADWTDENCRECDGSGHVGYEPTHDARLWSPSKRRFGYASTVKAVDPLLIMKPVRGAKGWGCMGPHVTYECARKQAMKRVRLPA